jgi:hypothetical protein
VVDLQPVFARARQLAADAVNTSGCTVRISTETESIDPDTLTTVRSTKPLSESGALVRHANENPGTLPGLEVRAGDYVVAMLPDVADPPVGSIVTVVTSVAGAPAGRLGTVRGCVRDAAGALVRVLVRP